MVLRNVNTHDKQTHFEVMVAEALRDLSKELKINLNFFKEVEYSIPTSNLYYPVYKNYGGKQTATEGTVDFFLPAVLVDGKPVVIEIHSFNKQYKSVLCKVEASLRSRGDKSPFLREYNKAAKLHKSGEIVAASDYVAECKVVNYACVRSELAKSTAMVFMSDTKVDSSCKVVEPLFIGKGAAAKESNLHFPESYKLHGNFICVNDQNLGRVTPSSIKEQLGTYLRDMIAQDRLKKISLVEAEKMAKATPLNPDFGESSRIRYENSISDVHTNKDEKPLNSDVFKGSYRKPTGIIDPRKTSM